MDMSANLGPSTTFADIEKKQSFDSIVVFLFENEAINMRKDCSWRQKQNLESYVNNKDRSVIALLKHHNTSVKDDGEMAMLAALHMA